MERTKVIESILKMKYDQYGGTYNIFMAQKHLKVLPLVKIPGEEDSLSSNTSSMDRQKGGQSSSRPVTTASKTKPTEVVDLDDVARRHHGGTRKHSNSHAAAAADTEEGNYDNLARVMLMVSKGFDEGQQDHRDGERIGGGNSGITATGGGGGFSGVNKSRVASNSTAPKDLPPPKHRGGGEILESISNNTNQNRHSRDPSSGVNAVTASGGGNNNNNTTNTGTIKRGARPSVSISNGAGVGVVGGGSNISRPSTTNQQMDNNSRLLPDLVKPSASKKMDNSTGWGGGGHSLPPINVDSPGLRSIFGAMDLDVDSRPGSSSKYGTLAPGTMTANMTYSQVTSGGVESNGGGSYVTVGNTGGGAGKKVAVGANNAGNIYNSAPFAYK